MKTSTTHTLVVMPDHTAKPIIDAIDAAKKTIRVKMFLFSDPDLLKAVIRARKRGVDVRVMLNPARRSGESENAPTHKTLTDAGIKVLDTNPAFDVTHEKSMVVDEDAAFVQSLNWETRNLTETRDYAIVTREPAEVAEVIGVLRCRLGAQAVRGQRQDAPDLVQRQRPRPHRAVHRRHQGVAVPAERAISGSGDHRTPGSRALRAA